MATKGTTWRSYLAEAVVWVLTVGAMSVSYWSQVSEVIRHGLTGPHNWTALVWGTSTDLGALIGFLLAREGTHRGTPTWGAWLISIACAALSIQFNVIGAWHRDWEAVEAHAWMPLLAIGSQWWMLHGRQLKWSPRELVGDRGTPNSEAATRALRDQAAVPLPETSAIAPSTTRSSRSRTRRVARSQTKEQRILALLRDAKVIDSEVIKDIGARTGSGTDYVRKVVRKAVAGGANFSRPSVAVDEAQERSREQHQPASKQPTDRRADGAPKGAAA